MSIQINDATKKALLEMKDELIRKSHFEVLKMTHGYISESMAEWLVNSSGYPVIQKINMAKLKTPFSFPSIGLSKIDRSTRNRLLNLNLFLSKNVQKTDKLLVSENLGNKSFTHVNITILWIEKRKVTIIQ
jgi:hypothetical protein